MTAIKIITQRLSQLTEKMNTLISNSKKIHELDHLTTDPQSELFIAVSDGQKTVKALYNLNSISHDQLANATNLSLNREANSSTITLKKVNGEVVSSIDLGFLSSKDLLLSANLNDKRLILQDSMGTVLSYASFEDLLLESAHHIYVVNNNDMNLPSIEFKLEHTPSQKEPITIFINGLFVNPDDFIISNNNVIIARTNIGYDIKEGNKITVNYKY